MTAFPRPCTATAARRVSLRLNRHRFIPAGGATTNGGFPPRLVPVVFLTARKTGEDVKECLKAGGNDFLVKPFDPVKLIERVEYWSGRRVC
jgi:CheY-like chemotaxis protein